MLRPRLRKFSQAFAIATADRRVGAQRKDKDIALRTESESSTEAWDDQELRSPHQERSPSCKKTKRSTARKRHACRGMVRRGKRRARGSAPLRWRCPSPIV